LRLLKSFHATNYLAICKIAKKHDKYAPDWKGVSEVVLPLLDAFELYPDTEDLQNLTRALEKLYLDEVAAPRKMNPDEALARLRAHSAPQESAVVTFLAGFSLGGVLGISSASFVAFAFSVSGFSSLFLETDENQTQLKTDLATAIPIYRLLLLPVLTYLFWGVNLMIFERNRVNVRYIMSADPKSFLRGSQVILVSVIILVVFLVDVLLFIILVNMQNSLGKSLTPLSLFVTLGFILILPAKMILHNTRIYFWRTMRNVFITPLWEIEAKHAFFADQWTSIGVVLLDLEYAFFFYFSGSFLSSSRLHFENSNLDYLSFTRPTQFFKAVVLLKIFIDFGVSAVLVEIWTVSQNFLCWGLGY
jgi:hypothetical protein